jgi:response regulator RpfG family c-di-GMP phosphodiesterase
VRHHHEHWDGTGYPDGLQGEQIPFGARILSVADAYDALNSTRPYRRAVDSAQIRCILQQGAGTQWDPVVVDELVAWLAETDPATVDVPSCSGSAA